MKSYKCPSIFIVNINNNEFIRTSGEIYDDNSKDHLKPWTDGWSEGGLK